MKLSCNVTRDLLPLYHDGVCSEESGRLVEDHIKDCADCRAILSELRGEIEVPREEPDDLAPLEQIGKNVKKGKKKAWLRGAAAVLAVVLMLSAAVFWMNDREQNRYRDLYMQFAEGQECIGEGYPYDYEWIHGNYLFRVTLPEEGSTQGVIEVREVKLTKDLRLYDDLRTFSMWISVTDDGYLYNIGMEETTYTYSSKPKDTDWCATMYGESTYEYITLTPEGITVDDESWDEETLARKNEFLETYRTEILNIITAAEREWPFLAE